MKLSLDASALKVLMDSDPEIKVELSRAVLSELVKKTFIKEADAYGKLLTPEVLDQALRDAVFQKEFAQRVQTHAESMVKYRRNGYSNMVSGLSEQMTDDLDIAMETYVNRRMREIEKSVQEKYTTALAKHEDKLFAHVNRTIKHLLNRVTGKRLEKILSERVGDAIHSIIDGTFTATPNVEEPESYDLTGDITQTFDEMRKADEKV